jgi:hypothetical protein
MNFPSWRYHRTKEAVIVTDAAELDALRGDGWADTPAAFDSPEAEPEEDESDEQLDQEEPEQPKPTPTKKKKARS